MGKSFTRALRHLKSNHKTTKLDEKKETLNEIPTMNMSGVYSKNPPGFRYDPPSPAKRFVPDIDGNWPAGVPGTPGATEYIRPQGYWVNDSDWDEFLVPDLRSDFTETSTTNTDGFIDPQTGTVKTLLPPNSRDFILGPLIDGYTYNHGYDDFTTIGYIQKDTRQIVVLGQISGHWDTTSTLPSGGTANRQWDGTASQFTAYNPKFTLAMAQWFKDKLTANDFTKNFPYFYSGGVPQSPLNPQPPGSPGGMPGGNVPGSGGGGNDPAGGPPPGTPTGGSGGDPDTGSETPQGDPEGTDPGGNNLWGMTQDEARAKYGHLSNEELAELGIVRNPDGTLREMTPEEKKALEEKKKKEEFDRRMKELDKDIKKYSALQQKYEKEARDILIKFGIDVALTLFGGAILKGVLGGLSRIPSAIRFLQNLTRAKKVATGADMLSDLGYASKATSVAKKVAASADDLSSAADDLGNKFYTTLMMSSDPKAKSAALAINRAMESGKDDLVYAAIEKAKVSVMGYAPKKVTTTAIPKIPMIKNIKIKPEFLKKQGQSFDLGAYGLEDVGIDQFKKILTNPAAFKIRPGTAKWKKVMQYAKDYLVEFKLYGDGQELLVELDEPIENILIENRNILREDKKRIIREITQPLKEIKELPKTQKLEKYRPNFKGKYKAQNTPNVTASKKSDEMVKAKNAAGQTWRTKDKYWGGYESQERMNVVYDNVGHGDQYWDKIVNENLSKRDVKNRRIQEHLNIIEHEKAMRRLDSTFVSPFRNIEEQETLDAPNDPLYKKVAKRLNTEIDYPKKPSPKGFPDKAPPKLDPNTGMHPKYGQRYKYDKLDPQSAEAMPVQGNPEIDANVQKALDKRAKDRKVKNLTVNTTSEKVDWRETLQKRNVGESKKNFKNLRKDLQEQLYTNITTGMKVGQTLRHIPSGQTFTTGGALGGTETLPSTFSIFGDPTPAPDVTDVSFYPLQGYAKPMDMMRRKNRENLEDINIRLDASQEFAKKVNSDVMMNARVSASPEAIQAAKQQSNIYIKQAAPGSYAPPVATSERNYGLTKDKIEIKDFVDALDKKSVITQEYGNKYTTLQRKMDEVGRGTSAAASIEKEIANLIDAEIAELDAVDQELDAVEKEKETPPPPLPEDEFPSEESPFDDAEARAGYEKARKDNPNLPSFDELTSDIKLPDIPKEGWTYDQYMAMIEAIKSAGASAEEPIVKEIIAYSPTGTKIHIDKDGQRNTPIGLIDAQSAITDAVNRALAALDAAWEAYNKVPDLPSIPDEGKEESSTEDDKKFLEKQQTLVNLTKGLNQIGLPNDFAQWTINYAKGDMTPINKFSRGMERQVRDLVLDKFNKNPNAKTVNIDYNDYGYGFKALPTRLGMGRFTATKLDNGKIRIQDTFNVNKDFTNIGSASIVPGLQKTADRLVDISYKNRNIQGREDKGGITIDVVIPGASAVKKYDKNKKRKVNESNTFSKVKEFRNK